MNKSYLPWKKMRWENGKYSANINQLKSVVANMFLLVIIVIYLILKVLLQFSVKYIILELKTCTNKIVKHNNCIDTTKTLGTIGTKDEDLHGTWCTKGTFIARAN